MPGAIELHRLFTAIKPIKPTASLPLFFTYISATQYFIPFSVLYLGADALTDKAPVALQALASKSPFAVVVVVVAVAVVVVLLVTAVVVVVVEVSVSSGHLPTSTVTALTALFLRLSSTMRLTR